MTLLEQVAALAQLQAAATPSPWRMEMDDESDIPMILSDYGHVANIEDGKGRYADEELARATGEFVAAAGSLDFAALLAALSASTTAISPAATEMLHRAIRLSDETGDWKSAARVLRTSIVAALSAPATPVAGEMHEADPDGGVTGETMRYIKGEMARMEAENAAMLITQRESDVEACCYNNVRIITLQRILQRLGSASAAA